MPTLAPEHVMAHLPEVSFVCRGAGERFLRELCDIVGEGDVDTPMDQHQLDALLGLDGLWPIWRPEWQDAYFCEGGPRRGRSHPWTESGSI